MTILCLPNTELPVLDYDSRLNNLLGCRSGASLMIDVNFTAFPDPTVEWFFNGAPLSTGGRTGIQTDAWHTGLNLHGITPTDAGLYKVKVTNKAGSKTATFTVGVKG
jgi:hypothetical protein